MPTNLCWAAAAERMSAPTRRTHSWVACDIFNRKMLTPHSVSLPIISAASVAGPRVAMILVLRESGQSIGTAYVVAGVQSSLWECLGAKTRVLFNASVVWNKSARRTGAVQKLAQVRGRGSARFDLGFRGCQTCGDDEIGGYIADGRRSVGGFECSEFSRWRTHPLRSGFQSCRQFYWLHGDCAAHFGKGETAKDPRYAGRKRIVGRPAAPSRPHGSVHGHKS